MGEEQNPKVRWREHVRALESQHPPRNPSVNLAGHEAPELLYDAQDWSSDPGFPGQAPFTRGIQPNMHRGRLWTMRQYAGFGTAAQSNARYRELLRQGQTGLSVAFDLPTQMGRDSDHPRAQGEVGRVGVAIDTLDDMRTLLADIPLERVSTSMTINATAPIVLAFYVSVAEERGLSPATLRGTIQNDILKEYIARGTYVYPTKPSLRLIRDLFAWCGEHLPKWNPISVSGYHMREAGCDAAQEVGFTLANGLTYVQLGLDAGLKPEAFVKRLSFFFNGHNNFVEEVAKFRAARTLWSRLLEKRFRITEGSVRRMKFHVQTAGSTLQAQQPLVNVVRTTIQAMAAVAGGCQSLHTNAYDEALSLPTRASATLALRTQQVIAHESGLADVVDALGGSHAIEAITERIISMATDHIEAIERMGGMPEAIEAGYVQKQIQQTAYQEQLDLERGERVVVGVNRFQSEEGSEAPVTAANPAQENQQISSLRSFRANRDTACANEACAHVSRVAAGDGNTMDAILRAVKERATLGEISDALRKVFGEHRETLTL